MLRWFEHSQVYHPDRYFRASAGELGRPFEDVFFQAADGVELNGWFFPAGSLSARRRMAMLFCHGNAGNIGDRLGSCAAMLETGVNVFVFDYRGYGHSQGRPSEEGTYRDAHAACRWLRERGFLGADVIAFGESLGGGVASELALHELLGGLALLSTFTSIPDLGADLFPWLPVRRLSHIRYDTRARLPRLDVPLLVMHSPGDRLVGFHHAEANFAAANEPKLFWRLSGGHNDWLLQRDHFVAGLEEFLKRVEAGRAKREA
jgi:fermentation-respiration switch protein FrsA (DUF1100 family)